MILNDHQAFYGHPEVKRPTFERLCREGVEFERAYCASPLCGPARRSMLTGLYPHRHGEIRNDIDHPYDSPLYLDLLAQQGHQLYYFGKWHAGAGTAHEHGCQGFSYPSYNNPYLQPEYAAYLKEKNLPHPEVFVEQDFIFWDESHRQGRVVRQDGAWCSEHCSGLMLTPDETHEAFFLAHQAREQLRQIAKSGNDKPFHLRVDFWGPHQPYFPTQRFAEMYDENTIQLPVNFYEDVVHNAKPLVYATEFNRGISVDGKLIYPNPLPQSVWRRVMARAYAQITMLDAAAGMVLDALDEFGLADDTLVVMTTDHGDGLACHGGHFDKGSYLCEEVLRIPMAIRCPGRLPAGTKSAFLSSNMDISPTLLDAADVAPPEVQDGCSLLAAVAGKAERYFIVCENHGHIDENIGRALIAAEWKYVYNSGQIEELYDLEQDPGELCNLASRPQYAGPLIQMRDLLVQWAQNKHDTVLLEAMQTDSEKLNDEKVMLENK